MLYQRTHRLQHHCSVSDDLTTIGPTVIDYHHASNARRIAVVVWVAALRWSHLLNVDDSVGVDRQLNTSEPCDLDLWPFGRRITPGHLSDWTTDEDV